MSGPPPEFIVGEVSSNWQAGRMIGQPVRKMFEDMLEGNLRRGYLLHSFQVSRIWLQHGPASEPPVLNETIFAVFRRAVIPQQAGDERVM